MVKIDTSFLNEFYPKEIAEFMTLGEPFVRSRTESDYWSYSTFFGNTCFAAVAENHLLVGALIGYLDQVNPKELYLQDLLVHPDYRRMGIAYSLYTRLETAARELHCERIWLTSETANPATAAWPKLGFTNPSADYTKDGFSMTKDLKGAGKDRAVFEKRLALCYAP